MGVIAALDVHCRASHAISSLQPAPAKESLQAGMADAAPPPPPAATAPEPPSRQEESDPEPAGDLAEVPAVASDQEESRDAGAQAEGHRAAGTDATPAQTADGDAAEPAAAAEPPAAAPAAAAASPPAVKAEAAADADGGAAAGAGAGGEPTADAVKEDVKEEAKADVKEEAAAGGDAAAAGEPSDEALVKRLRELLAGADLATTTGGRWGGEQECCLGGCRGAAAGQEGERCEPPLSVVLWPAPPTSKPPLTCLHALSMPPPDVLSAEKQLRKKLEAEYGVALGGRKELLRQQINAYLEEQEVGARSRHSRHRHSTAAGTAAAAAAATAQLIIIQRCYAALLLLLLLLLRKGRWSRR